MIPGALEDVWGLRLTFRTYRCRLVYQICTEHYSRVSDGALESKSSHQYHLFSQGFCCGVLSSPPITRLPSNPSDFLSRVSEMNCTGPGHSKMYRIAKIEAQVTEIHPSEERSWDRLHTTCSLSVQTVCILDTW